MQRKMVVGSGINTGRFAEFVERVFQLAGRSAYVCFANVHMVVEARQHPDFAQVLAEADLVCPDGKPVATALKLLYGQPQDRVAGMDLLPVLLAEAEKRGQSVFFYGSTTEVLDKITDTIGRTLPGLQVAGAVSPPFRPLTAAEDRQMVEQINASGAALVLVALGCPKQEKWMAAHKGKINACMLGVGQAFLTYAGLEKRLPQWARELSLEWLYRLWLEPRRLWKRYATTIPVFLALLAKQWIGQKMSSKFSSRFFSERTI